MKCSRCGTENPPGSQFCHKCGTRASSTADQVTIAQTRTLHTPQSAPAVGALFAGRYQIIEELGEGGMGFVYKALDTEIQEKVALKILRPEISADQKIIERFRNELKLARKISHQNVCRMYDLAKEGSVYYITMEHVSGEDLKSTLTRVGHLSIRKALEIAKQIAQGLAEAHRRGVTHRDLKPHNIMIDREGVVRIMDFGIARSSFTQGLTESGMMIGTPEYMSPEQSLGEPVDARSDIYSFGIVLFELLTGTVPFKGDTAVGVALKQTTDLPPEPRSLNPQIPAELNTLILKSLEKDKSKRSQSFDQIFAEIDRIEKSIPPTQITASAKIARPAAGPKHAEAGLAPFKKFIVPGAVVLGAAALFGLLAVLGVFKAKARVPSLETALKPESKEVAAATTTSVQPIRIPETTTSVRPEPQKAEPKASATYPLEITTDPAGASVWIDGALQGKAPISVEWTKDTCRIRIEKSGGWLPLEEDVRLRPGQLNQIQRTLKTEAYKVAVTTDPPGATVTLGKDNLGLSPVVKEVRAGKYALRIDKNGFFSVQEAVNLNAPFEKTYTLVKISYGNLRISADPEADVYIDGKLIGRIPPFPTVKLLSGKHSILFIAPGFARKFTVEVTIGADQTVQLQIDMKSGRSKIY